MPFTVKFVSGKSYDVTMDGSNTIKTVKEYLHERDTALSSSTIDLVYGGQSLDDTKTIDELDLDAKTVNVVSRCSAPNPTKKKKRCSFKGCSSAPLRMVGDCSFCDGKFCSTHRLLEQHNCSGLQSCKDQLHEQNASKLQREQTQANKV
ncbi:AN1-type zinc finger protein [Yarrowia sp. B02]|nr:AN1-type zinc finger protein [Yarrowia sp. B02]